MTPWPLTRLVAVDPGDKHVGIAIWDRSLGPGMRSWEQDAETALGVLEKEFVVGVQQLVVEKFRLYPDKAGAQSWSPMLTAEMIGALKWMANLYKIPVCEQGASIKKVSRAQCKARGLEWKDPSGHATDARLHAWYWLMKEKELAGFVQ